jgi:type VI protein secretion system component VasF
MTQEQLLNKQHCIDLIKDYEKEIIELKHINDALEERVKAERNYSSYLLDAWDYVVNTRSAIIAKAFWMGFAAGTILATALLLFFLS